MATATKTNTPPPEEEDVGQEAPAPSGMQALLTSIGTQSWLASLLIHMLVFIVLALTLGTIKVVQAVINTVQLEAPDEKKEDEAKNEAPEKFEVGETPIDPTELSTETLTMETPSVPAEYNDDSDTFSPSGGGFATANPSVGFTGAGGFEISGKGLGPAVASKGGGVGGEGGTGDKAGSGGSGEGFGQRGTGHRDAMLGSGGTKQSERAVAAALNWIFRHQNPDGSWSLDHRPRCKGGACGGPGEIKQDAAGTALGLLPYLAAGQTHQSKGPYQKTIYGGIAWLISHQKQNGDLSGDGSAQMYTHGLATIALCEAFGMTKDSRIGNAAQAAINFIETAQNNEGSWRYTHGSADSDTSVFGWQIMALKSGLMAGLRVNHAKLDAGKKWLAAVGGGNYKETFAYQAGAGPTPVMTAVGLLTTQYLGAGRGDPAIVGGLQYLMKNMPDKGNKNVYYWYYATQVLHNCPGPDWDTWNRSMRRMLIESQEKNGCAAGSWNPDGDAWGKPGGRMMVTSLSCLTLEVYYRYLPLYKLDKPDEIRGAPKAEEKMEK